MLFESNDDRSLATMKYNEIFLWTGLLITVTSFGSFLLIWTICGCCGKKDKDKDKDKDKNKGDKYRGLKPM